MFLFYLVKLTINHTVYSFEDEGCKKKNSNTMSSNPDQTFNCSHCGRAKSHIGLVNHKYSRNQIKPS